MSQENVDEYRSNIRAKLSQIIIELQSDTRLAAYKHAILDLLCYIYDYLLREEVKREDLAGFSLGIFRIVTDDYSFETSRIGKELLEIGSELRKLSKLAD